MSGETRGSWAGRGEEAHPEQDEQGPLRAPVPGVALLAQHRGHVAVARIEVQVMRVSATGALATFGRDALFEGPLLLNLAKGRLPAADGAAPQYPVVTTSGHHQPPFWRSAGPVPLVLVRSIESGRAPSTVLVAFGGINSLESGMLELSTSMAQ